MEDAGRSIPDDLLDKLHKATGHFHDSKEGLEKALDKPEFEHQHRVDTAGEELRKAEQELEDVEKEIKDVLPKQE